MLNARILELSSLSYNFFSVASLVSWKTESAITGLLVKYQYFATQRKQRNDKFGPRLKIFASTDISNNGFQRYSRQDRGVNALSEA